jgi:hypothetical protein
MAGSRWPAAAVTTGGGKVEEGTKVVPTAVDGGQLVTVAMVVSVTTTPD